MGLLSDGPARWIWLADRRRTIDCHLLMRNAFELRDAPSTARLRVAANDQYRLYVNGRLVGDGPARSEIPLAYYDTYQAPRLRLKKGRNVVALILHNTMMPRHGQSLCPGAAWAELEVQQKNGRTLRIGSDRTWRVIEAPEFLKPAPRRFFPVGFNEKVDFARQLRGWTMPAFDDSSWQRADEVDNWHGRKLLPRPVPPLRFEEWRPVSVRRWGRIGPLDGVFGLAFDRCTGLPAGQRLTFATFVHSDRPVKARFDFGCDNRARLYANGQKLWEQGDPTPRFSRIGYRGMTHGNGHRFEPGSTRGAAGVYKQEAELQEGWNSIRVWLWRAAVAYGFELAFLDPETGMPLPLLCSATRDRDATDTWLVLPSEKAPTERGTVVEAAVPDMRPWLEPSHLADWDRQEQVRRPFAGVSSVRARPRGRGPMTLPPGVFVESQLPADGAGFIDLELRGPRGAVVDVTCSEAQTRQARVRSLYNGLWQTDRLILSGRWDHWLSLDRRAGRYLCLCVRQSPGPVQVRRVALRTQHYPVSRPGTFQCSDWTLNRMWQAGAATVDASTFDLMEDCPTREKAQWAGDAFIRMHLMAWLWGDLSLSANAIREFARDQKPSRWARAMVPCGYRDVLVDTCFLLPRWAWDHYVLSGDLSVLKDSFQGVRNLFACAQTFTDRRGFVHPGPGGTVYVDYTMPPMSRCGDTFGALQAQYVVALEAAVSIAELLGKDGLARQWRKRADLLRQAIRDHFWVPAESLFVDGLRDGRPGGTFTAVTNYWMLFADVPTPEQERAMLRRLWPEPGREDMALWSRGESPYSKLYISEALLSRGLWRETLAQWRGYYGTMLRHPEAMSVFEMWNRSWPLDRPVPRNSLVHAFGIGPLSHLASRVAGVRPLQPGFGALLWEPMPLDLEWFSAELPLVGLDCTVHVEMQGEPSGGRRLVLTAPAHLKVGTSALYLAKGDTMAVQRTP